MNDLRRRFPIYARLGWFYPREYRAQYEDQTLQTLADMLDNAPGLLAKVSIWVRVTADFPISTSRQQLIQLGAVMSHETPHYIKRNALIGAGLVAPFFIIIMSKSLLLAGISSSVANKIFIALLVVLPAIAFVLNMASFVKWANDRRRAGKGSLWQSLFDLKHNWPALASAGLGGLIVIFVLFHDSTHCLAGNPIRELRNLRGTVSCLWQR